VNAVEELIDLAELSLSTNKNYWQFLLWAQEANLEYLSANR